MEDWVVADPGKPVGEGGRAMVFRMNDSHRPLRDWAFSLMEWQPGMRILDVGCGGGATIADMLNLSEESIIDGVDYSADCVASTSEFNQAFLNRRVFVQEGDVGALPYPDACYDLVTAVETVYFWPDLAGGFGQIYRVLKKGGSYAILLEVDGPDRINWEEVNFKMNVYRPEELRQVLHEAGFVDVTYHVKDNGYLLVTAKKQED